ncbi:MAG: hypothetical protein AAB587_00610 [Patescibacteria group bacterium]
MKYPVELLERTDLSEGNLEKGVFEKAKEFLGYGPATRALAEMTLQATLVFLSIRPFARQSVKKYQEEVIRRIHRGQWFQEAWEQIRFDSLPTSNNIWTGVVILSAVNGGILYCAVLCISNLLPAQISVLSIPSLFIFLNSFILGFFIFLVMVPAHMSRTNYVWKRISIKEYEKPIPENVLVTSVKIKENLPEVNIFVEELVRVHEPFLVVEYEGVSEYVEVWAEPDFKGDRIA